jgi:arginase family enzyme
MAAAHGSRTFCQGVGTQCGSLARVHPLDELKALLRPAAGGLYLVSTGVAAQLEVQRLIYGIRDEGDAAPEIAKQFERRLEALATAKGILLGIPSDVGAGFRRGANLGPQEIRRTLLRNESDWPAQCEALGVVDIGDVFVVPQLLHDSMLSEAQIASSRQALYPQLRPEDRDLLPVSPLSIAERALDLCFSENRALLPFVMGGDHSAAWPVIAALARVREHLGIVQPDAHTDLLSERLGVKYCFATWSYHANDVIGRGGRLVQVGTRASRRAREHWEQTLDVRQFWSETCRQAPQETLDAIVTHLDRVGATQIYFSNDIDGTDAEWADATGTPEPGGLTPEFVVALIRRLGTRIVAGDVMEVAPPLESKPGGSIATLGLAARYLKETIYAALGASTI